MSHNRTFVNSVPILSSLHNWLPSPTLLSHPHLSTQSCEISNLFNGANTQTSFYPPIEILVHYGPIYVTFCNSVSTTPLEGSLPSPLFLQDPLPSFCRCQVSNFHRNALTPLPLPPIQIAMDQKGWILFHIYPGEGTHLPKSHFIILVFVIRSILGARASPGVGRRLVPIKARN